MSEITSAGGLAAIPTLRSPRGAGHVSLSSSRAQSNSSPKWTDDLWGYHAIIVYTLYCGAIGLAFVVPGIPNKDLRIFLWTVEPVLLLLTIGILIALHYIDPGVIPPSKTRDPEIVEAEKGRLGLDLVIDSHGQWARRRLLLDGRSEITQRYCNTCNLWREPRTSHCSRCGYCMERFDHHCGAVGVCIARKNHRFFTIWLLIASVASGLFFYGCVYRLERIDWAEGLGSQSPSTYFLLILSLQYFYTSLLFFFGVMHCTILLCDCTTKQYLTRGRQGKGWGIPRPSLSSWVDNLRSVCCADLRSKMSVAPLDSTAKDRSGGSTV